MLQGAVATTACGLVPWRRAVGSRVVTWLVGWPAAACLCVAVMLVLSMALCLVSRTPGCTEALDSAQEGCEDWGFGMAKR
jgi:hypothetical protein